ncbi:uncharacterized protein [Aegilops tauschii subsp. strangulata]|uniref:uncharacterized protein n=1 Tax=Aegilops tauschii subsp. strangulata TaxID=200361 RepID=UPI003CC8D78B
MASFWYDSWMQGEAPFLVAPDIFQMARRKNKTVHAALRDNSWVRDVQGRVTTGLLPQFVNLWTKVAAAGHLSTGPDVFTWKLTESGVFSTRSAYHMQFLGSTRSPLMAAVWKAWAPAKIKFFAWLLAINRLLTADRLMARQWPNCYFCPLCMRSLETNVHLFQECPWARRLWATGADRFQLPSCHPDNWSITTDTTEWLLGLTTNAAHAKKGEVHLPAHSLDDLGERNNRIFRGQERSVERARDSVGDEITTWTWAGGKHLMPRE